MAKLSRVAQDFHVFALTVYQLLVSAYGFVEETPIENTKPLPTL